jgi:hypothetical protein
MAHNIAYYLCHDVKPWEIDGLEIHHICNNKICCNPIHLALVTRLENISFRPKLFSKNDIDAIRKRIENGETLVKIAKDYKVSDSAIWKISHKISYPDGNWKGRNEI